MFKNGFILGKYYIEENIGRIIKIFSFLHKSFSFKSSRRERLTPVLSHHRTYGSVYGGSIKIIDASLYITSVNSCSLYASGHSTLQEVSHGIHRFLPRVRYYVFCVHHDGLNAKGYSLLIVRSFRDVPEHLVL